MLMAFKQSRGVRGIGVTGPSERHRRPYQHFTVRLLREFSGFHEILNCPPKGGGNIFGDEDSMHSWLQQSTNATAPGWHSERTLTECLLAKSLFCAS